MASHTEKSAIAGRALRVLILMLAVALVVAAGWYVVMRRDGAATAGSSRCPTTVTVVTASSFATVLGAAGRSLRVGADCVQVDVKTSDGRAAAAEVAQSHADAWIPDDAAWRATAAAQALAPAGDANSGSVLATSPIYMVTDGPTGGLIRAAGSSWLGLSNLLKNDASGVRLVVRDPSASGDGMVAAGAVGEAVWLAKGMDASSLALADTVKVTRTVTLDLAATPEKSGEVGLIPEYALLPTLTVAGADRVYLTGADHTAELRFTWLPTSGAVADPKRFAALSRLFAAFSGPDAVKARTTAGLRGPDNVRAAAIGDDRLPKITAEPFEVLAAHQLQHIFATWDPEDRRSHLLIVVDVATPPGTSSVTTTTGSPTTGSPTTGPPTTGPPSAGPSSTGTTGAGRVAAIDVLRQGCRSVSDLLPDGSRLGLWQVGAGLDPPRAYRQLVPTARLNPDQVQRGALNRAVGGLTTHKAGPGLYDAIADAYADVRNDYQSDMFNQVLVFTDDQNGDSANTTAVTSLTSRLTALRDPERPVHLSVVVLGQPAAAERLNAALKPLDAYVDQAVGADDIQAAFIHVVAGGLHA